MELVPKIPSERHVRTLHRVSALAIAVMAVVTGAARHDVWILPFLGGYCFLLWLTIRVRDVEIENAMDRLECTAMISARNVAVAAALTLVYGTWLARIFGVAGLLWAVALVVHALLRDRERAKFLSRVYAGEEPELRVVRDTDVRGFELLPAVLSGTLTDAVIAHTSATHDYRTSHGPRALARVTRSLAKMETRFAKRRRGAFVLAALTATPIFFVITWGIGPRGTPALAKAAPMNAPACRNAVPYFEERLQTIPGVGRATLIAREHDGLVVYAPKRGVIASPELDAKVLETARSIPCSDKLTLAVAQPRYVAFDVSAELAVDENADEAAVRRDAEEQVRALFQPDAHALDNEHFGFGATEKTFGYRVRHALRHVSGVRSVKLSIDGADREVPLEPTDFPTLHSLSIR
jgi:hypothetical protein